MDEPKNGTCRQLALAVDCLLSLWRRLEACSFLYQTGNRLRRINFIHPIGRIRPRPPNAAKHGKGKRKETKGESTCRVKTVISVEEVQVRRDDLGREKKSIRGHGNASINKAWKH